MSTSSGPARQKSNAYELFILVLTVLSLVIMAALLLPLSNATISAGEGCGAGVEREVSDVEGEGASTRHRGSASSTGCAFRPSGEVGGLTA
jgi:hypothetical protein